MADFMDLSSVFVTAWISQIRNISQITWMTESYRPLFSKYFSYFNSLYFVMCVLMFVLSFFYLHVAFIMTKHSGQWFAFNSCFGCLP